MYIKIALYENGGRGHGGVCSVSPLSTLTKDVVSDSKKSLRKSIALRLVVSFWRQIWVGMQGIRTHFNLFLKQFLNGNTIRAIILNRVECLQLS